ncbi:hypothetical protein Bca4012_026496 [Brassica carinata]
MSLAVVSRRRTRRQWVGRVVVILLLSSMSKERNEKREAWSTHQMVVEGGGVRSLKGAVLLFGLVNK